MPATSRYIAETQGYHLIVTVWQSSDHKRLGGSSWRAATGTLSTSGEMVEVSDASGATYLYPPTIDPSLSVTQLLSTAVQSVSVSIQWDRDTQNPGDVDLRQAVGEVALINEASGGTAVQAWEQRHRLIAGPVTGYSWGDGYEGISLTIAGEPLRDDGDFYGPGAELSSDRFADITAEASNNRSRAFRANGLLPPIVYAPVGSGMLAPCIVVKDEVDATSGGASLAYRRHLVSYRRPTSLASTNQFQMPDPDIQGDMLGTTTDSTFQVAIASDTDLLNTPYWYVPGSFRFSIDTVTLTGVPGPALATGTVSKSRRKVRVGWQIRGATGGNDDYLVIISEDGTEIELGDSSGAPVNYGGPDETADPGYTIPLPSGNADSLYWIPKLGGIAGQDGNSLTNVIDVLLDFLRLARFTVPVCFGDLEALRTRLQGLNISWVCRERQSPWAKALQILQYLPIRPYLSEGVLRFRWTGTVTAQDIVTTIDLDTLGSAYRMEPLSWVEEPVYPLVTLRYFWNAFRQAYTGTVTLNGSKASSGIGGTVTGRGARAYAEWRDSSGFRTAERCPTMNIEADTLEQGHAARLAALWLLYRWGLPRQRCTLEIDASYRWLAPGDVIRVTQTGVTYPAQMWRVEGITLDGMGGGRLILEGVVS